MNEELISVIVPVYNKMEYIEETIDSVRNQTYSSWELLLIDDGSTDLSVEICERFALIDTRIRLFHTENRGVSAARNTGLEYAQGEWITFLDADDRLSHTALEVLYEKTKEANIIFGGMELFPEKKSFCVTNQNVTYSSVEDAVLSGGWVFDPAGIVSSCAKLYRKSCIRVQFDERLRHAEDFDFNLENLPLFGRLAVIPEIVYHYRKQPIPSLNKRIWLDRFDISKRILGKAKRTFGHNQQVYDAFLRNFACEMCDYFVMLSRLRNNTKSRMLSIMQVRLADEILQQRMIRSITLKKGRGIIWQLIKLRNANVLYAVLNRWGGKLWRWYDE